MRPAGQGGAAHEPRDHLAGWLASLLRREFCRDRGKAWSDSDPPGPALPASRQQTRRVGGRRGGPSPTRVVFRTVATVRFGGLRAQHRLAACRCGASVPHHMLLGHRKLPRHLLCYQITPPTERHQPGDGQFRLMLYCASILAPSLVQIICPP